MMERDFHDQVKEFKEGLDILEVIGSFGVELKRTGKSWVAKCPFHDEKTASFHVHPEGGYYKCFGCGTKGDVIGFVMEKERRDFSSAIEYLSTKYNVAPIIFSREDSTNKSVYSALEAARSFFEGNVSNSAPKRYLESRKIDAPLIRKFHLGYALNGWENLKNSLTPKFSIDTLRSAGLVREAEERQGHYYDYFRNRIVFPLHDISGRVVGFGARALDDSKPKYLNSPETSIFSKKKILFGIDLATQPAREKGELILVEGYTDVIAAHAEGIENVAGTIGTAFTDEHVNLLSRRFSDVKVVLAYDGDSAGRKTIISTGEKLLGSVTSFACVLPLGEDPASIHEKSGKLEEVLLEREPFFDFWLKEKSERINFGNPDEVKLFLKNISPPLSNVPSDFLGIYADVIAEKIGIDSDSVKTAVLSNPNRVRREFAIANREYWERCFLYQVLHSKGMEGAARRFKNLIPENDFFSSPEARALFNFILNPQRSLFHELDLFSSCEINSIFEEASARFLEYCPNVTLDRNVFVSFFNKNYFRSGCFEKPRRLEEIESSFLNVKLADMVSQTLAARRDITLNKLLDQINLYVGGLKL